MQYFIWLEHWRFILVLAAVLVISATSSYLEVDGRVLRISSRTLSNATIFVLWITAAEMSQALFEAVGVHHGMFMLDLDAANIPLILKSAMGFVFLEVVSYSIHVLEHRIPMLWRFHRLHHSESQIDVSTFLRRHPVSAFYHRAILSLVSCFFRVNWIAMFVHMIAFEIVGIINHSSIAKSARLNKIATALGIQSPAEHHIHHSGLESNYNRNFGSVLSILDRLFGSYQPATRSERHSKLLTR